MNWKLIAAVAAAVGFCAAAANEAAPLPFVSPIFGDHMVLQRGATNTIWGWSAPGDVVRVEIGGRAVKAVAGADGKWTARIEPPAGPGPVTVKIDGAAHVELHDVLIGDVWLCGGQSNMELGLAMARNGADEIKAANHPNIRFFNVRHHVAYAPAPTAQGTWRVCSPESVAMDGGISAVAYFFARRLQQDTGAPIGLVEDCVGGTPAESWTGAGALRSLKDFDAALDEVERLRAKGGPQYGNYVEHWYDEYDIGQKQNWFGAAFDDHDWTNASLVGGFAALGTPETPAVGYFRLHAVLPDPLPTGPARIKLGVVERMDTVQINGRWIGASAWVENPRNYAIPAGVLRPGTNVIAVRVLKTKADGGFKSKPEELQLTLGDKTVVPLTGDWKAKLSVDARPPHPLPAGFENWPTMPSVLYNGMIAPLAPLALTGAIWYQGEANAGRGAQYQKLLPAMIADWRRSFAQGDFPFYIVSLAAYMQRKDAPGSDGWAELREAQDFTANTVTNSGLALAIDVGDANNIHPKDKKEVGERLALLALAKHYGKTIPFSGPQFASAEQIPGGLRIHFDHTDGGLSSKGDKLGEFSVCGESQVWHWAEARIDGDTVVVTSAAEPKPLFVRYAWQSNPAATLYNGAGLPAVPFRTDPK